MEADFHGEASPGRAATYIVDIDGTFLAYGIPGTTAIEVVYLQNLAAPPLQLSCEVQQRSITALCLGSGTLGTSDPRPASRGGDQDQEDRTLLCAASKDAVVIWDLATAYAAAADGLPLQDPILVMSDQGQVDAVTMSASGRDLVICAGAEVHVYELPGLRNTFRLEGHYASVLAACFCEPHASHQLITAGEDRTFKVWDLREGVLLYQSSILTASPLTSVSVDPSFPRVAVGAADGVVRFFDLASLPACRCLQVVDVSKQLQKIADGTAAAASAQDAGDSSGPKVIQAKASRQPQRGASSMAAADAEEEEDENILAMGSSGSVIRVYYSPLRSSLPDGQTGLLRESPKLLVGTVRAIAVLDTHTYEVVQAHYLRGGVPSRVMQYRQGSQSGTPSSASEQQRSAAKRFKAVPECSVAGAYAFALEGREESYIYCAASAAFEPCIGVLRLAPALDPGVLALAEVERAQSGMEAGWADGNNPASSSASSDLVPQTVEGQPGKTPISVFQTVPLPAGSPLLASSSSSQWPSSSDTPDKGPPAAGLRSPSPKPTSARSPSPARPGGPAAGAGSPSKASASGSGNRVAQASPGRGASRPGGGATGSLQRSGSSSSSVSSAGSATKKAAVANQPVTFHRKVKSSGYGYVQPAVKLGRAPPAPVKVSKGGATSAVARHIIQQRQYPVDCEAPVNHQPRNALPGNKPAHNAAVLRLAFSSDASRLVTAGADRTARVMKLPLSKFQGEGTDLIAHNAAVTSVSWSHDGTLVLTASADRSARLWNAACATPLLSLTHTLQQVPKTPTGLPPPGSPAAASAAAAAASNKLNKPFLHEVRAARFFYMDNVILLASGNKLGVYRYKLVDAKDDDIERLRNNNKYRLVGSYSSPAQCINEFSCVNTFLSPLALLAGSNRSIEVVDISTLQCVSTIEDSHSRPVHSIVQSASSSLFVSHPKEAYELFATSAQDGCVKLWDVRVARCVRTFSGHKNSTLATGIAFSPCLRFLASGSEDKVAYLYDIRMGHILHRVRGVHGDAVTDVAFNPLHPQLAVACLDGRVHFYSDVA